MLNYYSKDAMELEEIKQMFSEIGLGTSEQRDKIVKDLFINMVDSSNSEYEVITSNNSLNSNNYA